MAYFRFASATPFFNRTAELGALRSLTRKAGNLLLVSGPRDSGKSSLMREFASRMLADHTGTPILIDMRDGTFNTAGSFAQQLQSEVLPFFDTARAMITAGPTIAGYPEAAEGAKLAADVFEKYAKRIEQQPSNDMSLLLTRLQRLFTHWRVTARGQRAGIPTLIIDEANRLLEWRRDSVEMAHLTSLTEFFVKVTKQEQAANVLLCSSEDFFRSWMRSRLGPERVGDDVVIGDLVDDDAKGFFLTLLENHQKKFPEELWKEIFEYLGGRMHLLRKAAFAIEEATSNDELWKLWQEHRQQLEERSLLAVREGFTPERIPDKWTGPVPGSVDPVHPCWTAETYRAILQALAESDGGIVSQSDLVARDIRIGELDSLIMHNFFHQRERSQWAKDVAGYKGEWPAIMSMSKPRHHAITSALSAGVTTRDAYYL